MGVASGTAVALRTVFAFLMEETNIHGMRLKVEQLECLHPEIPPPPPLPATWLHILVINIRYQVKTRQSQSHKFKKNAKNLKLEILQETLYATHLLKWLDKVYNKIYEMDPTRTVGTTERTQSAGWKGGRSETNRKCQDYVYIKLEYWSIM